MVFLNDDDCVLFDKDVANFTRIVVELESSWGKMPNIVHILSYILHF